MQEKRNEAVGQCGCEQRQAAHAAEQAQLAEHLRGVQATGAILGESHGQPKAVLSGCAYDSDGVLRSAAPVLGDYAVRNQIGMASFPGVTLPHVAPPLIGQTTHSGATGERYFTRSEVLAILQSRKAILEGRPHFSTAVQELDTLIEVFARMK